VQNCIAASIPALFLCCVATAVEWALDAEKRLGIGVQVFRAHFKDQSSATLSRVLDASLMKENNADAWIRRSNYVVRIGVGR